MLTLGFRVPIRPSILVECGSFVLKSLARPMMIGCRKDRIKGTPKVVVAIIVCIGSG